MDSSENNNSSASLGTINGRYYKESSSIRNNESNGTHLTRTSSRRSEDLSIAPSTIATASLRPSSSVASPYLKSWQLLNMDDDCAFGHTNHDECRYNHIPGEANGNSHQKPSASQTLSKPKASRDPESPAADSSSIYGTKSTKKSLEDDDPSDSTANIIEHLTLQMNTATGTSQTIEGDLGSRWAGANSTSSTSRYNASNGNGFHFSPNNSSDLAHYPSTYSSLRNVQSNGSIPSSWDRTYRSSQQIMTVSSLSSQERSSVASTNGEKASEWNRRLSIHDDEGEVRKAKPKNDDDYVYDDDETNELHIINGQNTTSSNQTQSKTDQVTLLGNSKDCADDFIPMARENLSALMSVLVFSAASSRNDADQAIDVSTIETLMECCRKDQESLQGKLQKVLEEEADETLIQDLFGINEEILSALDAGTEALTREKESSKRKEAPDGPTIDLLEENRDVFSLICMLRATNEKRMQAAMALMKFAKDDQVLRGEILSSGGIHSFLTLFQQTRSTSRELKVVASLAVAYILPSYVSSSQTTTSIGLKLVQCLHYLATSDPVSANGMIIEVEEMCRAASVGVNVLWVNSIQPLVAVKKAKENSSSSPPSLRPGRSIRFGRLRSQTGAVFDKSRESVAIQELTELAVTLIAHLAKLTERGEVRIDTGYNIVEQVCEVHEARPIAVREGLLPVFVKWIRSGMIEKVRPAASALRYLISIQDKYMAGWIHSQVVNEGAVSEIVKLLNESVGQDVRLAVAEMLSHLCIAPHTRAAVVQSNGVNYLVSLIFEHSAPDMEEIVMFACTALLQLAAGAMIGAGTSFYSSFKNIPEESNVHTNVINDIINGCAHGSFVDIAREHNGKLRSISVEALRVLSEDTDSSRQTRLQLCSVGAAETLGVTVRENQWVIELLLQTGDIHLNELGGDEKIQTISLSVKNTYSALRALANILEPQRWPKRSQRLRRMDPKLNASELLVKGCRDLAYSEGILGILQVSTLKKTPSFLADKSTTSIDRADLLEEACRLLANLSPLLLSGDAASGLASWTIDVFEALDGILNRSNETDFTDVEAEINLDALRGIASLAVYEPLKVKIVNQTLPRILVLKNIAEDGIGIATAANQVLQSMGFIENEITAQVAGNNPQFLVDLFCLQRCFLLQTMVRAEIRRKVSEIWQSPLSDVNPEYMEEMRFQREHSQERSERSSSSDERSFDVQDDPVCKNLFENFTSDYNSLDTRREFLRQYLDVYESENRLGNLAQVVDQTVWGDEGEKNMMAPHVFPLSNTREEKDWILSHYDAVEREHDTRAFSMYGNIPKRTEKLLDSFFPSKLLRNHLIPIKDLRPLSSFNFRAFMMPKRRYFSFRREGELLGRLFEKQGSIIDSDNVHWTLGFTNSTFAGEFVESLVQALYKHPMITGLSFVRNPEWITMRDKEKYNITDDGGGLLANLTGSLPPWVSHLTFDNMLNDRDLRALVAILDTIGKLSSGQDLDEEKSQVSMGASQGNFTSISIRNSPQISVESWSTFFQLLGRMGRARQNSSPAPLSMLKILDLSGNNLGDEAAAMVLDFVHDKYSGCSIEQLDLAGNRIGRGENVVRVLRSYTEYYRYNQKMGVRMMANSWKSSLHTLVLASNDLFLGEAGLEIFTLLKHDALCLRYLDLSDNGLENESYQLIASCLLKNTSLCHLNLSGNKFDQSLVDLVLDTLNETGVDSNLSFLLFESNTPALTSNQKDKLAKFLRKSRKNAINRHVTERQKQASEEVGEDTVGSDSNVGDLEIIDEGSIPTYSRISFTGGHESSLASNDQDDNQITVLFSAPLVFADGENKLHPFAKLDFEMERELLWQCMKEASRDIDISFDNAHHSRLLATLTRRCSVLHYSGHGHQSFLPFEDGMGGPNWLGVQDIKELILQDGVVPFKFVFVSACHSGLAGETFASAGVPHVVCCKQESELKDTAALAFTRSFYLALLVGHTVKESFDQGCKAVRATPNLRDSDEEMKKFVLLPKNGDHNKPVFRAKSIREWPKQQRNTSSSRSFRRRSNRGSFQTGGLALGTKSSELSVRNMMQEDPSPTPPQFFLGREMDLYYVLSALLKLNKRLVSVLGDTGIGRSSLACALCHYINERASTISEIQQIYFIKPKQRGRNVLCRSLVQQLLEKLIEKGKCRPTEEETDTEGMLEIICRKLKTDKCLIVFDRTELIKSSDVDCLELPRILSTILYETKQVRVLITGHSSLGQPAIGGQVEHSYTLGPLTFSNSVKLFAKLCPHLHTPSERGMLSKKLVRNDEDQINLLPGDLQLNPRTKNILSVIGDGIPSKIEKAAYGISRKDLTRLQEL